MIEMQLFIFFVLVIIVSIVIATVAVFRVRHIDHEIRIREAMRSFKLREQPTVTVLILADECTDDATRTLSSFVNNSYKNFDIVVVSTRSSNGAKRIVDDFIKHSKLKKTQIAFIQRRIRSTVHATYKAAYRKSRKGKIIITVKAGSVVESDFIKRAVVLQNNRNIWKVVIQDSVYLSGQPMTLLGSVQALRRIAWQSRKSAEVFSAPYFMKANLLDEIKVPADIFSVAGVVGLGIILYLGIIQSSFVFMWYLWVLFSMYLFAMIWLDPTEKTTGKSKLMLVTPSALFLLPIASFVQGISQFYKRK